MATVLLVEDESALREKVRDLLVGEGYKVLEAADGREALTLLGQGRPDVLLLDLLMPGLDGWSVLRELEGKPGLRDLPVVLLTGADEKAGGDTRGFPVVRKPFASAELLLAIFNACGGRQ